MDEFTTEMVNELVKRYLRWIRSKKKRAEKEGENIHKIEELIELMEERLNIRKEEKRKAGEVFTPMWLIREMIEKLPKELLKIQI